METNRDIITQTNVDLNNVLSVLQRDVKDASVIVDGQAYEGELELVSSWEAISVPDTQLPFTMADLSFRAIDYKDEIHLFASITHHKLTNGEWVEASTPPILVYSCGVVVFNDEIHVLGSGDTDSQTKHYKFNGSEWSEVSTLPYNFYGGCAVVYNNEIHILGGSTHNYTKHYKFNGSEWSEVSTLPYNFYGGCAVVHDNKIFIGGYSSTDSSLSTNFYHWDGALWTQLPSSNKALSYGFLHSYHNEIHAFHSALSDSPHSVWDGVSWSSAAKIGITAGNGSKALHVAHKDGIHELGGMYTSNTNFRTNRIVLRFCYRVKELTI